MIRRDDGEAPTLGPSQGAVTQDVGRGDVDEVRPERLDPGALLAREASRDAVFRASWRGDGRNSEKLPRLLHRWRVGRRTDDEHLVAFANEKADEPPERPGDAVFDVDVVARKESDAERARGVGHGRT